MKIKALIFGTLMFTNMTFAQKETDMKDAFFKAVTDGDAVAVQNMLRVEPKLATAKNQKEQSAILLAAYYRKNDIAAILIKTGVELDIFEAAATGQTERVLSVTAKNKAIINSYSPDGFSPLLLAVFFGHQETAFALIDAGANLNMASTESMKVTPLHSAVAAKQIAIVRKLIAKGANVNARAENDLAPLHEAAANGDLEFAKLLLDNEAAINLKTKEGKTALSLARDSKHSEMVAFLSKRGAMP